MNSAWKVGKIMGVVPLILEKREPYIIAIAVDKIPLPSSSSESVNCPSNVINQQWLSLVRKDKGSNIHHPQNGPNNPRTSVTANDQIWRSEDTGCDFRDSYMLMLLVTLNVVIENY